MNLTTNNPCYIPNGQVIIFNFPAGAGGKMLQNCVALSRHCVFNSAEYARWQVDYQGEFDSSYYNQKLKYALSTLPPQGELNRWLQFELGENKMYGINFESFHQYIPIPWPEAYNVANAGLWAVITVHNHESSLYYQRYWPTIRWVCLVNNERFARKNLPIKCGNNRYDTDWNTLGISPESSSFYVDVDDTIYHEEKFLGQVKKLYEYLGFEDFQQDLVKTYYQAYIKLHQ
jgi:hypothetical protein